MSELKKNEMLFLKISKKVEKNLLNLINPLNSKEEKKIFFQNNKEYTQYNPRFLYLNKIYFTEEKEQLKELLTNLNNRLIEKLLLKKINCTLKEINLLETINTKKLCNSSKKLFGEPTNKEVKLALEILQQPIQEIENNITPKTLLKQIQNKLINTGFSIELKTNMSAKASVNLTEKKIYLNKNSKFNNEDLNRFNVHEIETHIYRYLNGLNQPTKILSIGTGEEYLKTEEGLAIFNEKQTNTSGQEKIIAGRLYAVNYTLTHDFFDTFDELTKFFDKGTAYEIAQRVKRGIPCDEKGAFTKDYCYFSGLLKINDYYNKGNSIKELYYGKISIEEIKIVKKINGIQEPTYLPRYLVNKNLNHN